MNNFTVTTRQPILEFLKSVNPHLNWKEEFAQGKIRVGKHFVGPHYMLYPRDRVTHDPNLRILEPEVNFGYKSVYQDEYIVAIEKPAPLPMHPTGTYFHHTLTQLLLRKGKPWHTVHRLDSETSGILLLAKKKQYTEKLRQSLLAGSKFYLVLVYGQTNPQFIVNIPLGKKLESRIFKRQGYHLDGKKSMTLFRRVSYLRKHDGKDYSLLMAQPLTGRTHQIRAHLAESNFPVVGDKIYGKDENYFLRHLKTREGCQDLSLNKDLELDRQFLHCYSITIIHPFTQKRIRFKSELPDILKNELKILKRS